MKDIRDAGDAINAMGGYWYLSSPYTKTANHLLAYMHAAWGAAELMKMGARVFSPIVHGHAVASLGGLDHLDADFWMDQYAPMMSKAHGIIVLKLPGWNKSKGVRAEIAYFRTHNRPVYGMKPRLSMVEQPAPLGYPRAAKQEILS